MFDLSLEQRLQHRLRLMFSDCGILIDNRVVHHFITSGREVEISANPIR